MRRFRIVALLQVLVPQMSIAAALLVSCAGSSKVVPLPVSGVTQASPAGGRVVVIVSERDTGRPTAFANVTVLGTRWGGMTDELGTGVVSHVEAGMQLVAVRAIGFFSEVRPVSVGEGRVDTIRVSVISKPVKSLCIEPCQDCR